MIKHLSLDLWNTLLVSNYKFSIDRINYLQNHYFSGFEKEIIDEKIENIGMEADKINMKNGISISSEKMYNDLLRKENIIIKKDELTKLYEDLEIEFLNNIPNLMYDLDKITNCFENLKSNGFTLNISSNTAFIKGKTLLKVLKKIKIHKYFDFFIFSDEIDCSKPSKKFFDHLIHKCSQLNLNKNNILHIGDSLEADIVGANQSGIKSKHIIKKQQDLIIYLNSKNFNEDF